MLAKVTGLFRLTRDSELKYTPSGSALLKLGLANGEKYKDKETTLFIDAVVFGKPAEIINQYAGKKGTQIYLVGKLQTEQWQDQQSGQNRSKISMTVEGFDFVSNKLDSHQQNNQQGGGYNQPQQQNYQQPQQPYLHQNNQPQQNIPEVDMLSDEIPF